MKVFDKRMALELIEDALMDTDSPHGCGMATGLCGAFYMCGLLSKEEWVTFLGRIPAECCKISSREIFALGNQETKGRNPILN